MQFVFFNLPSLGLFAFSFGNKSELFQYISRHHGFWLGDKRKCFLLPSQDRLPEDFILEKQLYLIKQLTQPSHMHLPQHLSYVQWPHIQPSLRVSPQFLKIISHNFLQIIRINRAPFQFHMLEQSCWKRETQCTLNHPG